VRLASGVITAGGTLGILIPPSVMIIVYAAVAGQSIVKLYAAAMLPGLLPHVPLPRLHHRLGADQPEDRAEAAARAVSRRVPAWLQGSSAAVERVSSALLAPVRLRAARRADAAGARRYGCREESLPRCSCRSRRVACSRGLVVRRDLQARRQSTPDGGAPQRRSHAAPPAARRAACAGRRARRRRSPQDSRRPAGLSAQPEATAAAERGRPPRAGPRGSGGSRQDPGDFYAWFWGFARSRCSLPDLLLAHGRRAARDPEAARDSVVPLGVLTFIVLAVILFGITTASESAGDRRAGRALPRGLAKYRAARCGRAWSGVIVGVALG
jgi:TRAP-type mannitol/chloroaromatic compound transport system permease large subunit